MKRLHPLLIGLLAGLALTLAACGGGGGGGTAASPDRDGDGVPNTEDAAPDDGSIFAAFADSLLEQLDPAASTFSAATDINNSDLVVGYSDDATSNVKAVKWTVDAVAGTATAPTILNPIAGHVFSSAYGANDLGVVVGESSDGAVFTAVIWGTGLTDPTALNQGALTATSAYGINGGGQIVGEGNEAGNIVAVLWNDVTAAPALLGTLGGLNSSAYFVNDGGVVVGEADTADGETHAALWLVDVSGAVTGPFDLGKLNAGDLASVAFSVNDLGQVVGESEDAAGEIHAVQWTVDFATGTVTATTDMGTAGSDSGAYANSGSSQIVGYDAQSGTSLASVWDDRNLTLPNPVLAGAALSQGYGTNDSNLAVGVSGTQAFVAVPQ